MQDDVKQQGTPEKRHSKNALLSVNTLRLLLGSFALLCLILGFVIPYLLQAPEGKQLSRWAVHVRQMLPTALIIDGLVLTGISFTAEWWFRGWQATVKEPLARDRTKVTQYILLAAIMLFTIVLNAPRLTQSLWGDEEWTMRHNVVGDYIVTKEGALKFKPVTWGEATWSYLSPNNHCTFSLLSKASHTLLYRSQNSRDALYFSEIAMRMPSFIAGLLALFLVYQLMSELGFPRAGIIAAALLSLHPWFVRYSTEARGYGLLFVLWPLALLMLLRGLRTGEWRWWIAFGLCQWFLLSTWMLQIHWVLAMNMAAVGCLWGRRDDPHRVLFRRWLFGCLIGVLLTLPTLLPAVPQILAWMQGERAMANEPPWRWCIEAATWLLTGQGWHTPQPISPYCIGRDLEWPVHALKLVFEFGLPAVFIIGGSFVFTRVSKLHRWVFVAMLLPFMTVVLQAVKGGNLLLPWYASPLLPAFVMLMSLGIDRSATILSGHWQWFAAMCFVVVPGAIWSHECSLLRSHDFEPILAATRMTRDVLNPKLINPKRDPITVQFCLPRQGYDPACVIIKQSGELEALISQARQDHRALFIHLGDVPMARLRWPEIMTLVDDKNLFESLAVLYGMEHAQTRQVWKLK